MIDHNFHIDTPRLTLSHLNSTIDSHPDFLVALWTQPSALRATGGIPTGPTSREEARKQIEDEQEQFSAETGYGRYLISLKTPTASTADDDARPFSEAAETYTKIGTVTMKTRRYVDMPVFPDVGFGLLEGFEGKGYATEAANALMEYLEEVTGKNGFLGLVHPDNEKSIAMMKRLGFREEGLRGVLGLTSDGSIVVGVKALRESFRDW
jgi:RimJ/RimL family protein N-acetyltransferase